MQTMISALHFEWRDLPECLARAQGGFGLDGVEFSWHECFTRPHCTAADLEELPTLLATTGASAAAHIWEDLPRLGVEGASAALDRWLACAVRTGVRGLVVHGGSCADRRGGLAMTATILDKALPAFARAGVRLLLENHYPYAYHAANELFSEPWEFAEIAAAVSSPALGFCFDTGHAHMAGNTAELIRAMGPRLAHVHLADNHGVDDDHCAFGEGTVPWTTVFGELAAIGFDGTFCVEFPVRGDPAPLVACLREIRRVSPAPPRPGFRAGSAPPGSGRR